MISKNEKIFIAGHNGMVGSACFRIFKEAGYNNLLIIPSQELDLMDQRKVNLFFDKEKPNVVINCAAKVGGIQANDLYPYVFLMNNLLIQNNLIKFSHEYNVRKFIFLGSSCIYPKYAEQPIRESSLLTSSLEPTNQWYAIAKISGVKLIESLRKQYNRDYLSLMPTNLYGPNDNYDLENSHVLPALIKKFHDAKTYNKDSVEVWGSGKPRREFLHVNDLARAVLFSYENNLTDSLYNVGSGIDISIAELANLVREIVGYEGEIKWNSSKPDGTPKKLMDSSKLNSLGWKPKIDLKEGIKSVYKEYAKVI